MYWAIGKTKKKNKKQEKGFLFEKNLAKEIDLILVNRTQKNPIPIRSHEHADTTDFFFFEIFFLVYLSSWGIMVGSAVVLFFFFKV